MTRESSEQGRKSTTTVVDPRATFALWLRTGRARKNLTLEDVARITKIQPRILEKLESGHFDGLPAEVFVRGFVRCFARCVGLDENEALERYRACSAATAPVARAFVETLVPPARASAPAIEIVDLAEPVVAGADEPATTAAADAPAAPAPARTGKDRSRKRNHKRKARAAARTRNTAEPATAASQAAEAPEALAASDAPTTAVEASAPAPAAIGIDMAAVEPARAPESAAPEPVVVDAAPSEPALPDIIALPAATPWVPKMPSATAAPNVPWRRGRFAAPTTRHSDPRLVIDDADPESAEREQEERAAAAKDQKVSFLPPILLDREDRSARQGGLTLAVILLLVAATLTLSYLMRRPSTSGDGVTLRDTPARVIG